MSEQFGFLGSYESSTTSNRIVLPALFKRIIFARSKDEPVDEAYIESDENQKSDDELKPQVVITAGWDGKHLAIFTADQWKMYSEKMRNGDNEDRERFMDQLDFCSVQNLESNGRIRIPDFLFKLLKLKDGKNEVMILGRETYIEVWEKERYEESRDNSYHRIASLKTRTKFL